MKIDGNIFTEAAITKGHASSGGQPVKLEEGQILNARVLSMENGNALLKTQEGYILRARLDGDIILEEGSKASFIVAEQKSGFLILKMNPEAQDIQLNIESAVQDSSRLLADRLPAPMQRLLTALNIPVTEDIIGMIHQIMKDNSHLTAEKALFLALNRISPQDSEILFSKENNTAALLNELIRIIDSSTSLNDQSSGSIIKEDSMVPSEALPAPDNGADINSSETPVMQIKPFISASGMPANGSGPSALAAGASAATDNTEAINADLLKAVVKELAELMPEASEAAKGHSPLNIDANKAEIVMPDSRAAAQIKAALLETFSRPELEAALGSENPDDAVTALIMSIKHEAVNEASVLRFQDNTDKAFAAMPENSISALLTADGEEALLPETAAEKPNPEPAPESRSGVQRTLLALLSRMPAYDRISNKALAGLQEIINNSISELEAAKKDSNEIPEKLIKYINKLFAELNDGKASGAELRKARDELYLKLSVFKEELAGTELAGKTQIIEQTQKLLDHMRILNDIDQFVYCQLPVRIGEEPKTAELYIFKKKQGAKRIDPDDVKILLALDLTHLGHIESLISIKGKEVALRIDVSENVAEAAFLQNTIFLHKMLAEIGYKLTKTDISRLKEETSVESAMLRVIQFEESVQTGVDITI